MSDIDALIISTKAEIAEAEKRLKTLLRMKEKEEANSWVTAKDAADQLGISVRTIPVWCADGKLDGKRPGKKWLIDRFVGGF